MVVGDGGAVALIEFMPSCFIVREVALEFDDDLQRYIELQLDQFVEEERLASRIVGVLRKPNRNTFVSSATVSSRIEFMRDLPSLGAKFFEDLVGRLVRLAFPGKVGAVLLRNVL